MKKFNVKHLYWMIPTLVIAIDMLVLECLPNGVEMVFKWPIDIDAGIFGSRTDYYPYFSGMPYNLRQFCTNIYWNIYDCRNYPLRSQHVR